MPESPQARIIETVRTKCITIGEALKIKGQKHKQNLPENCSKALKFNGHFSMQIFKIF